MNNLSTFLSYFALMWIKIKSEYKKRIDQLNLSKFKETCGLMRKKSNHQHQYVSHDQLQAGYHLKYKYSFERYFEIHFKAQV